MPVTKIDSVVVSDGKGGTIDVRAGDSVALIAFGGKIEGGGLSKSEYYSILKFLEGEGPYKIRWIGQWPCGAVNIYLNLPNGR